MRIPDGYVLVPVDSIKAIDMGWAYLDAAREAEPEKSHSFSHAGYRAMVAAAPPAEFPAYDEAKERELFDLDSSKKYGYSFIETNDDGEYVNQYAQFYFKGWLACAKSRAGIQS